jgi:hypothetical protein
MAFGWGVLRTSGLIRNNAVKASSVDSALRDTGSALFPCFSGFCVASCAVPSAGGHTLPHILMADLCCGSKADVARPNRDVRFGPRADIRRVGYRETYIPQPTEAEPTGLDVADLLKS